MRIRALSQDLFDDLIGDMMSNLKILEPFAYLGVYEFGKTLGTMCRNIDVECVEGSIKYGLGPKQDPTFFICINKKYYMAWMFLDKWRFASADHGHEDYFNIGTC